MNITNYEDELLNMSVGTGAIGDIKQNIGSSIRQGFGRSVGSFYPRSLRRQFNIEFQRGSYNQCKSGINEFMYECDMPSSYYPKTYGPTYPYQFNYDPYPEKEDCNYEFKNPNLWETREETREEIKTQDNKMSLAMKIGITCVVLFLVLYMLSLVNKKVVTGNKIDF